ncbi:hypothetical protein L2E82_05281 [Cichorium intybus]|uniref:Uncharacterized protein n=1 Tax=Cichorium intybus TaxID=13427 RepID=A0ACB9H7I5_CICIN|nr:hypothetical protein L2E82_05281 [Cichorium intybus]
MWKRRRRIWWFCRNPNHRPFHVKKGGNEPHLVCVFVCVILGMDDRGGHDGGSFVAIQRISQGLDRSNTCHTTGQDRTARIRVEHVIREEKLIASYDLIEIYCELIVGRLPIIESQKCTLSSRSIIFNNEKCNLDLSFYKITLQNMGLLCIRHKRGNQANTEENVQILHDGAKELALSEGGA